MSIVKVKYNERVNDGNDDGGNDVDKEILVNIDCPIGLILDYVREVVQLDKACKIDLCDESNCQLRNLSIVEPSTSGLYLLQSDITYFIVVIKNNANDQTMSLVPLVGTKIGKKCLEILKKTRQRKNSQK